MTFPSDLPVVLLHGCGGSAEATYVATGWIERLQAAGRTALPVTLPGHGAGASHDPADYEDLAGAVLAVLPRRFDAVGFSLGGKLLLEIASRAPERVNHLVLGGVGDNVFAPETSGEVVAATLEQGIDEATPPALAGVYRYCEASGVDLRAVAAVLRRTHNPILDVDRLKRISAPILLVIGDEDAVALPATALISALSSVRSMIIPGVDHFALPANPDFLRHALSFLAVAPAPDRQS